MAFVYEIIPQEKKSKIDVDFTSRESLFKQRMISCLNPNNSSRWVVDSDAGEFLVRLHVHHGTYPSQSFGFYGKYCISLIDVRYAQEKKRGKIQNKMDRGAD